MIGEVQAAPAQGGIVAETRLDPNEQPFLFDHRPDANTPWLPGVMAIEGLAEAAALLPGAYGRTLRVAAVEEVTMQGALKFFRMAPRTLQWSATARPGEGDELIAEAVLRSVQPPAREGLPEQVREHFAARVRLSPSSQPVESPVVIFEAPGEDELTITADEIYRLFFHGPAYRVIERAAVRDNTVLARMPAGLPPDTHPAGAAHLMAPRLVELCFQAAALWCVKSRSAMAFPSSVGRVIAYRQPEAAGERQLYGKVWTSDDGASFDGQVFDESGAVYVDLRDYRTVTRPM
jgi:hypothetical protein